VEGLAELAFRRHHAQIYRYLRRRTGDPEQAADLTQEVFTDAAATLARTGRAPDSMLAWLYTIAQRRFADEARRRQRSVEAVALNDALDELPSPDYGADLAQALRESISRLAPSQRQVVSMKLLRGFSFCEIANEFETSEAAAKMRFQRALSTLRADLQQQGIGL
jgi:RNA polymerase sigma-70 factor, ECF subfamily